MCNTHNKKLQNCNKLFAQKFFQKLHLYIFFFSTQKLDGSH